MTMLKTNPSASQPLVSAHVSFRRQWPSSTIPNDFFNASIFYINVSGTKMSKFENLFEGKSTDNQSQEAAITGKYSASKVRKVLDLIKEETTFLLDAKVHNFFQCHLFSKWEADFFSVCVWRCVLQYVLVGQVPFPPIVECVKKQLSFIDLMKFGKLQLWISSQAARAIFLWAKCALNFAPSAKLHTSRFCCALKRLCPHIWNSVSLSDQYACYYKFSIR